MPHSINDPASALSDRSARRLILGIETSCDETAAAVVDSGSSVLSNVIASQNELHAEYRGVVPEIASRAHAERILPIIQQALTEARISLADLDAVAVGNRPGLIGPLLVGVAAAKTLAFTLNIPIIGVDHVRAHLIAGLIGRPGSQPPPCSFPALGLIVSGGHTSLYLCNSPTHAQKIGATIDDALGEAYDKLAAILDLGFPGGPRVDQLARAHPDLAKTPDRDGFPIARIAPDSLDFSFSGLKTAALYAFRGVPLTPHTRAKLQAKNLTPPPTWSKEQVAATFQAAAVETVRLKIERALDRYPACKTLLVGGGVSANSALRQRLTTLAAQRNLDLRLPAMEFCLDNAAMIAALGFFEMHERNWRTDPWSMSAMPTTGS